MPNGLSGFNKTRVTPQNLEIFAQLWIIHLQGRCNRLGCSAVFSFRSKEGENTGELLSMIKAGTWG